MAVVAALAVAEPGGVLKAAETLAREITGRMEVEVRLPLKAQLQCHSGCPANRCRCLAFRGVLFFIRDSVDAPKSNVFIC